MAKGDDMGIPKPFGLLGGTLGVQDQDTLKDTRTEDTPTTGDERSGAGNYSRTRYRHERTCRKGA